MWEIWLTGTGRQGEEKDLHSTQTTVKLSYLTHISSIISSGQFTFLPTPYDHMIFMVSLSLLAV